MTTAVAEKELVEMNDQIEEELKTNVTFEIKTDILKELVNRVNRSVAKTTTIEALKGIYLYVEEDRLTLRAMNSDFGTEAILKRDPKEKNFQITDGSEGGAVFLDNKFSSIIGSLPRKKTTISIHDKQAMVKSGSVKFHFNILDVSEFPRFPQLEESAASIRLPADVLNRMYDKTVFACSSSEARPILTGVKHSIKDKTFTLVATDSFRLAQVNHDILLDVEDIEKVIPAKTLVEVQKQLKDSEEVVIHFMEHQVIYECDKATIYGRTLEGKYPATDRLIPTGYRTEVQFKVSSLRDMIKRALLVNDQDAAKLKIKAKDKQVRLLTREDQKSQFQEDISPVFAEGEDIQLGLNVKYLLDSLNHYPNDALVKLQFVHNMKPFLVRMVNGEDRDLDLILPVKMYDSDMQGEVIIENFQGDIQTELFKEEAKTIEETTE